MEFRKILVPVAGSEADTETIKLACRLGRKEKAKILALHVIPIERSLPMDAELTGEIKKAEDILLQAEKSALAEGCEIETDLLQARNAGPSIVDEAMEREIDLIVMGITYKRHYGQFNMGRVPLYILKNAPCPVMLFQQYQPE
jgi:nucleotide-binding universal stress UspA family protein